MEEQLVDTWRIHNRINLYMLDAIEQGALDDSAVTKGRSVGAQLAHIHDVRRGQIAMRLKLAGHPLDNKISYGMWE